MNIAVKPLEIKMLDRIIASAPPSVLSAIQTASARSGVDFSYLVQQAKAESSFDPKAKAGSSSASGLYQFIDSTWLQMVDRHGKDYGIDTTGMSRKEILAMRDDPKTSSFMAAAFASENEQFLNEHWGGKVGATELYFAHFLGAGGAASFLKAKDENPLQAAADLFPKAAQANRNVFYDSKTGEPRTLAQVYDFFDKKFDVKTTPDNFVLAQNADHSAGSAQKSSAHQNQYDSNSIYAAYSRNTLSKSPVMQRALEMRQARADQENSNSIFRRQANFIPPVRRELPFYSLVARPVDLMLLTQTAKPGKVIGDNNA